ncbi:MAG: hypothetical protein QXY18_01270 [Nitrososphaerota archaeon]
MKEKIVAFLKNIVATDSVGWLPIGINPEKGKYLKLFKRNGLGIAKKDSIKIIEENINKVFKNFKSLEKFMN